MCRIAAKLRELLANPSFRAAAGNMSRLMRAQRWTPAEQAASAPLCMLSSGQELRKAAWTSLPMRRATTNSNCQLAG